MWKDQEQAVCFVSQNRFKSGVTWESALDSVDCILCLSELFCMKYHCLSLNNISLDFQEFEELLVTSMNPI